MVGGWVCQVSVDRLFRGERGALCAADYAWVRAFSFGDKDFGDLGGDGCQDRDPITQGENRPAHDLAPDDLDGMGEGQPAGSRPSLSAASWISFRSARCRARMPTLPVRPGGGAASATPGGCPAGGL